MIKTPIFTLNTGVCIMLSPLIQPHRPHQSKNAESFYITKAYINDSGKSTSKIIRKLGTLKELSDKLATDRDGVMAWAKEQAAVETLKYKQENESKLVVIPFHADRQIDFDKQKVTTHP